MTRQIFTEKKTCSCWTEEFTALVMMEVEGISVLHAVLGAVCCHCHSDTQTEQWGDMWAWTIDQITHTLSLSLELLTCWPIRVSAHAAIDKAREGWSAHMLFSSDMTPSSVSLALATASQPLLASGFLGDGCMMPSTRTLTPAADRARRARCSATLPTPITMEMPSAFTAWQSALSHRARRLSRSPAGSSGGVKFFPVALMKMSGHRLCTKQCWKNSAGSPHNFLKKPQKRAPLTSLWVQASPVIRRFGCSSGGWPTSPVISSQSTTDLTSPKGTCAQKRRSFQLKTYHHKHNIERYYRFKQARTSGEWK